jgi:hypothetical protein
MGIYTSPHHKAFGQKGNTLVGSVTLTSGTYNVVVEEWDNCGGAATTTVKVVVQDNGLPPNTPYQFAYMPDVRSGTLQSFWISPESCALHPVLGNPSPTHYHPVAVVKDSPYVFVLNRDTQDISIYIGDDNINGGLTQIPGSPFSLHEAGAYFPTGMVVPNGGSILGIYVTNMSSNPSLGGTVGEYNFDIPSGKLTELSGSPVKLRGNVQPRAIFVGPEDINTGNWLFTANGSSISVLGSAPGGSVDEVDGSPFAAPGRFGPSAEVKDIATLQNGIFSSYVYTANSENSISAFQLGSHGQLTPLPGSPYLNPDNLPGTLGNPTSIAIPSFSANGETVNLYALNAGAQDIGIFNVDLNTGIPTYGRAEQQGRVLADPSDRLRGGANFPQQCLVTSNGYSMSVDSTTGSTTLVPGSPFLLPGTYPAVEIQLF